MDARMDDDENTTGTSEQLEAIRQLLLDQRAQTRETHWFTGAGAGLSVAGFGVGLAESGGPAPAMIVLGGIALAIGLIWHI